MHSSVPRRAAVIGGTERGIQAHRDNGELGGAASQDPIRSRCGVSPPRGGVACKQVAAAADSRGAAWGPADGRGEGIKTRWRLCVVYEMRVGFVAHTQCASLNLIDVFKGPNRSEQA